jgi:preprotein translocase subunit YajC
MDLTTLLFPLLILVLFIPIFLSGRRQKRQMSQMQNLQSSLHPGDVVVTTSGLRGTVTDSSYEDTVDIEIAEGIVTTWLRAAVREKVEVPGDEIPEPTHEVVDGGSSTAGSSTVGSSAGGSSAVTAPADKPVVDAPSLEKADAPSLQKDDSTNGTARG